MPKQHSESVPQAMQPVVAAIVAQTDAFCQQHLDDEYATLARALAATLARKRPSPLTRGKPQGWVGGILYALGTVNFLFDKTQTPHMRADELCAALGVSSGGCATKAKQIREMLDMLPADPRWYRPSRLEENPLAWLIVVDGLLVDARNMPREIQKEALQMGLIPFLPGRG